MLWRDKTLGLKFENNGSIDNPCIKLTIFSPPKQLLTDQYRESLTQEISWRFNFNQNISKFCSEYKKDEFLEAPIRHWKGMKPIASNSLYEMLVIYVVLQNATVKRSVQMLENLFARFGRKVSFNGQTLSVFWSPNSLAKSTEKEIRALKVGYRAKSLLRISEQFASGIVDEYSLRRMTKETVGGELDKLYGIGPASIDGLLFELFYFVDALEIIPPWEQKIMSRLLFERRMVPASKILRFFKERYGGYEKLAFHYLWEDLFWRRKSGEHIAWLEKEIRL